jgi:hypothetical protein
MDFKAAWIINFTLDELLDELKEYMRGHSIEN